MTPSAADRPRCADAARQRGDPQLGTAPLIRRWLLIEHPGPWPVEALTTADFSTELRSSLASAARAVTGRVLLVRRPGRSGQARTVADRAWAVVGDGGARWGRWSIPDDLEEAAAALRDPHDRLPHPSSEPIVLICTHGVHDTCCALRGRPVAAALAQQWPEATWECSHVGGCRFAPNLIVLPEGIYYGYADPAAAVDIVRRHLAGEVPTGLLRGLARQPPAAQVALGVAQRRDGLYGPDEIAIRSVTAQTPSRWEIGLSVAGRGDERLTVVASSRPRAHLTCRAAQDTAALQYDVLDQS